MVTVSPIFSPATGDAGSRQEARGKPEISPSYRLLPSTGLRYGSTTRRLSTALQLYGYAPNTKINALDISSQSSHLIARRPTAPFRDETDQRLLNAPHGARTLLCYTGYCNTAVVVVVVGRSTLPQAATSREPRTASREPRPAVCLPACLSALPCPGCLCFLVTSPEFQNVRDEHLFPNANACACSDQRAWPSPVPSNPRATPCHASKQANKQIRI